MYKEKEYCIISIVGSHAGESIKEIFKRKIKDTKKIGKTFWLINSYQAKPNLIQEIYNQKKKIKVYFIEPSRKGGAIPTKVSKSAKYYSIDNVVWIPIPKDIGPITGNINNNTCALIMNHLKLSNGNINLKDYANFFNQKDHIKLKQGCSTICAVSKRIPNNPIKSNLRKIVAIGTLYNPSGVWLKSITTS